jgi:hypothetical protein
MNLKKILEAYPTVKAAVINFATGRKVNAYTVVLAPKPLLGTKITFHRLLSQDVLFYFLKLNGIDVNATQLAGGNEEHLRACLKRLETAMRKPRKRKEAAEDAA